MDLIRVQYRIFDSRQAALAAGYPDAEWGESWQISPGSTEMRPGWIALDCPDEDE